MKSAQAIKLSRNATFAVSMNLFAFTVAMVTVTSDAHAFGSKKPITQIVGEIKGLKEIPSDSPELGGVNFNYNFKIDYNRDGVKDLLECHPSALTVTIRDGKNLNNVLYRWAGPVVREFANGSKRYITGCSVEALRAGYPSIFVSMAFAHPTSGMRVRSNQFVIHSTPDAVRVKEVRLGDKPYWVTSRSVKCAPYPLKLVQEGYKPGLLCFYAGYDNGLPNGGYGTNTALLKVEETDKGELVFKDLTPKSGLIWRGGINGTSKSTFPIRARKYDGLHMMDSVFMDYNKDGLVDLITFGQHASVRASKMNIDKSRPEGVRFDDSYITIASSSEMTEYLTANAFEDYDGSLRKLACYIATGEDDYGARAVPTYFRCFESGKWVKYNFPGDKFFSWMSRPSIKNNGRGKVVIRARDIKRVDGKDVPQDRYFSFDFSQAQ